MSKSKRLAKEILKRCFQPSKKSWKKDLAPEQLQADSLYGSDDNCQQAEQIGVEVISPSMGTENPDACSLTDFKFLANGNVDTCPAGHEPRLRNKKNGRYSQGFDASLCESCPLGASCPAKKGSGNFYLRYTAKAMRLARRRRAIACKNQAVRTFSR